MSDHDPRKSQASDDTIQPMHATAPSYPGPPPPPFANAPFQTQLEYLAQTQQHSPIVPASSSPYGQQAFDMYAMSAALPPGVPPTMTPRSPYEPVENPLQGPSNAYRQPPPMPYAPQRGSSYADPTVLARLQQQQIMTSPFIPGHSAAQSVSRQPTFAMPPQVPYSPVDPYGYPLSPGQYSPIDPRFVAPSPFPTVPPTITGRMPRDAAQFARRGSDTAPIPTFPRGPPRKPKQSGHALWVGNLPPAAQVIELKDHFSRDASNDIESVFLIAKSNCAFVNYRTDAACMAAMTRFHDSRFNGVRLVCRLRRGTTSAASAAAVEDAGDAASSSTSTTPNPPLEAAEDSPTIARSPSGQNVQSPDAATSATGASDARVTDQYFIIKSLTAQDLEASVRNGIWATQTHNEDAFNRAFERADNVYLIFSANKSGEYFGYARMASAIAGERIQLSTLRSGVAEDALTDLAVLPQSIPTPATATAPKGRIIDDSARGTIFWEADRSDEEEEASTEKDINGGSDQDWGRQFQIEWISTNRLPFYRTRGLRNPWNANREVKIARDGTELEPSVGRRLLSMFQRPATGSGPVSSAPAGIPL